MLPQMGCLLLMHVEVVRARLPVVVLRLEVLLALRGILPLPRILLIRGLVLLLVLLLDLCVGTEGSPLPSP